MQQEEKFNPDYGWRSTDIADTTTCEHSDDALQYLFADY
jgi:hypothetical protein